MGCLVGLAANFIMLLVLVLRKAPAPSGQGGFLGGIAPGFRALKRAAVLITRPSPAPPSSYGSS